MIQIEADFDAVSLWSSSQCSFSPSPSSSGYRSSSYSTESSNENVDDETSSVTDAGTSKLGCRKSCSMTSSSVKRFTKEVIFLLYLIARVNRLKEFHVQPELHTP